MIVWGLIPLQSRIAGIDCARCGTSDHFKESKQPHKPLKIMHISSLKQSKFLTKADVNPPILVTIEEVYQENISKDGAPEELKWCIKFREIEKPMVLNSTNGQIIAQIVKSEETDTWTGHKIVLYDDPNVSFGGKLVGGIRARAPRGQAAKAVKPAPAPKPAPEPVPEATEASGDPDVPF